MNSFLDHAQNASIAVLMLLLTFDRQDGVREYRCDNVACCPS